MAYSMESYLFQQSKTDENVTWSCIIDALLKLATYQMYAPDTDYGFVILETDTPKDGCVMMQTAKNYGAKEMTLEIRYEYPKQQKFRQYTWDTTDFDAVLQYFYDFFMGKALDISPFTDITEDL